MNPNDFTYQTPQLLPDLNTYTSEAPSNIALVKYWGKYGEQLPKNTSISFTLEQCKTYTEVILKKRIEAVDQFHFEVFLDKEPKPSFKSKIETFLRRIEVYTPFLKSFQFEIHTRNTFPHSSGIASSASGMAALAKCFVAMEASVKPAMTAELQAQKASFLARLGSGSACRSTGGKLVVWGKHKDIQGSSGFYGIDYPDEVHHNFRNFRDSILLIDEGQKQVSSSVGHNLMHGHPFAEQRFQQADKNITKLKPILASGNYEAFFALVESEALSLHAMMMTSSPYFILMQPQTLEVIHKLWKFRASEKVPVGFTLDAGANVHILYPQASETKVRVFIEEHLLQFCQGKKAIHDQIQF
ncbi:diphosphomevalonate decarboxylase [Psychroflexus sp. YR1-1]|uniref:Diphosphomevalonate decarboxylase n=1 Tax=Psychroflexus aurantiacus TaxID=2709310 RepID=A0A6B3R596_9FLAO|nr:diphosphomevalonate decarboxylase [Psychroflexus aurantiacus]NEV92544.1 diphosphomevalonate decarboxylase [Psychroflexus aurantiacus]